MRLLTPLHLEQAFAARMDLKHLALTTQTVAIGSTNGEQL